MIITLTAESKVYGDTSQYIARGTSTAQIDEPGLYELGGVDKKGNKIPVYRVVIAGSNGELVALRCSGDNADGIDGLDAAMQIAKRLQAGEVFLDIVELVSSAEGDKYRIRSKSQAVKAAKMSTIQSVTDECWALLQNLPATEGKAVLAMLKSRIAPKVPAPDAESADYSASVDSDVEAN